MSAITKTSRWINLSADRDYETWIAVPQIEAITYDGDTTTIHTKSGAGYLADYKPRHILELMQGATDD